MRGGGAPAGGGSHDPREAACHARGAQPGPAPDPRRGRRSGAARGAAPGGSACPRGGAGRARRDAGGANAERELHELGVRAGSPETQELARLANEHSPVLRTHDRYGHRIDEVEFHPAWHELMTTAVEPRAARGALAGRHTGCARGPRRRVLRVDAGRGRARLPGLDDLRRGPAAAARAGARGQVRAAARRPGLRPRAAGARQQGGPAGRHGHDRETGRLRRTGQHHPRGPGRG